MSYDEYAFDIVALIAICLCKPIFPPSGVSSGSIIPHCELCNKCGATTFAVGSNGNIIFLKCEINVNHDNLFKSCTRPTRLVCSDAPQFPLNPTLNPRSTVRSLKISFSLSVTSANNLLL